MALQVVWLKAALDEVEEIAEYIARDSPRYATVVVSKLIAAATPLAELPMLGPMVPEWRDEMVRQRIVYSYRLIYRLRGDRVEIIAVWHGARQLLSSIRRREDPPHQ